MAPASAPATGTGYMRQKVRGSGNGVCVGGEADGRKEGTEASE